MNLCGDISTSRLVVQVDDKTISRIFSNNMVGWIVGGSIVREIQMLLQLPFYREANWCKKSLASIGCLGTSSASSIVWLLQSR